MKNISPFQFITTGRTEEEIERQVISVIAGGCKWIQLRMKDSSADEITSVGNEIMKICRRHNCMLIINDHPQVVAAIDADGVHLGKEDVHPSEARKLLGDKIIGGTANIFDDVLRIKDDVDYIGLGPFRFTSTKKNLSPVLGMDGYKSIVTQLELNQIKHPVIAIGGITLNDVPEIMSTGVYGIAVSSGITSSDQPHLQSRLFLDQIEKVKETVAEIVQK